MKKILLSTALILSTLGCYSGDAALSFGHVNCYNRLETCQTSTMECDGFRSFGSDSNTHTPDEKNAVIAAAQACSALLKEGYDKMVACKKACAQNLVHHCTSSTNCGDDL